MYQDAVSYAIGSLPPVYHWGLFVALGCLLAGAWLLTQSRVDERKRNTAALTCLLSLVLGLLFARLVYAFAEVQFAPYRTAATALDIRLGGFSMFGALAGAVLGALWAARIDRVDALEWLDQLAPALLLFVFAARLGEGGTALGISRPLVTGVLDDTFLAYRDAYDAYLRTYLLESFGALVLFLFSLRIARRVKRSGGVFLWTALMFGISQNLFESLRYDGHLRFSFIGLQQLLAVTLFSVALISLAMQLIRRKDHRGLGIAALAILPLLLAAILGLEFMVDRSSISKWLIYGLYVVVLAGAGALGSALLRRSGYNG